MARMLFSEIRVIRPFVTFVFNYTTLWAGCQGNFDLHFVSTEAIYFPIML